MSFYTSLNGLTNAQTELGVISNNLANANTTGFKSSRANFADMVAGSAYTNPKLIMGIGSTVSGIDQSFKQGAINQTGSSLDLAINGNGFLATKSALSGQVNYTRNGNFAMDGTGFIIDGNAARAQMLPVDASGNVSSTTPIDAQVPLTNAAGSPFAGVTVKGDGSINAAYADGTNTTIGKVALANFIAPGGLRQIGTQDWQATGLSGAATYAAPGSAGLGNVLSGALEQSNVDVSAELVGLINAQQYFQANAKAISTYTQITTTIINQQG